MTELQESNYIRKQFQLHSDTSKSAADAIDKRSTTLRTAVHNWLVDHGPATDEQIQESLRMNPSTQRPRRVELVQQGLVKDSGERGKTRSGRHAILWSAL